MLQVCNDDQQTSLSPYFNRLSSSQPSINTSAPSSSQQSSATSSSQQSLAVRIKSEPGSDVNDSGCGGQITNCLYSSSPGSSSGGSYGPKIDPVAPVCLKHQRKAFRPPVTIKNFFKSTSNCQSNAESSTSISDKIEECRNGKVKCSVDKENYNSNVKESSGKPDLCVTITETTEGGDSNSFHVPGSVPDYLKTAKFDVVEYVRLHEKSATENKLVKVWQSVNSGNSNVPRFSVTISSKGCEECRPLLKFEVNKTSNASNSAKLQDSSSMTTKRKADNNSTLPSAKKRKQSSIMNSFSKAKSVSRKKDITCPICQMKFDSDTDNSEVNKHIDNCLIE